MKLARNDYKNNRFEKDIILNVNKATVQATGVAKTELKIHPQFKQSASE